MIVTEMTMPTKTVIMMVLRTKMSSAVSGSNGRVGTHGRRAL